MFDATGSDAEPPPARSPLGAYADALNRAARALAARPIGGASPLAAQLAFTDFALSLAAAPGTQWAAAIQGWAQAARLGAAMLTGAPAITPDKSDKRFANPAWAAQPFALAAQAFLLAEEWADQLIAATPGMSAHHRALTAFLARQTLDMLSPSNAPALNPEVLARTAETGGRNLIEGMAHLRQDLRQIWDRSAAHANSGFVVGRDLAATPGAVVLRNDLIELIQYAPRTDQVRTEPVLIVPAWIMKYYVLDLSAHNSLIGWLVDQGFTVFCISWRNPDAGCADVGFDAYRQRGFGDALAAALAISGAARAHVAGYCLGGTLAAIAASAMARDGDARLSSLTLLAAQIDFTEAGELSLFIDDQQLATLDAVMAQNGVLDSAQMTDAFAMLGARDLIWSKAMRSYLLGEPAPMTDLMAWNADATRMPARMHSEYLHGLFNENRFANGAWRIDGAVVRPDDITVPIFAVGTETDHVAPWRSVFKIQRLKDAEITFALTNGGHNGGIVSPPGHPHRQVRVGVRAPGATAIDPEQWLAQAARQDGSWWPVWGDWLARHSGAPIAPPPLGSRDFPPLCPAPGTYVLQY
jgi:polyhydroxyalkanoate synthase subunit PhaC